MTDTSSEFDWGDAEERDCIVQQAVPRVAIYSNPYGDVVIRREQDWPHEENDPFIVIARAHAVRAAHAILEAANLGDIQFYRAEGPFSEGPFSPIEVAMMNTRPDIDWKAALEDFNRFEAAEATKPDGPERERVPLKERRARVEAALRANPSLSNRAIAAECAVSDKTVAAVRAETGAESAHGGAEIRTNDARDVD